MEDKLNELDVLFPHKDVELAEGVSVAVRPIAAENLTKALKPFSVLFKKVSEGVSPAEIAIDAMESAMQVLPFCINRPLSEVPVTKVPDLLEAMIELNLTPESVKKWKALVLRLSEEVGSVNQKKALPV